MALLASPTYLDCDDIKGLIFFFFMTHIHKELRSPFLLECTWRLFVLGIHNILTILLICSIRLNVDCVGIYAMKNNSLNA